MLYIKLRDVSDCMDLMSDLFLEGLVDKVKIIANVFDKDNPTAVEYKDLGSDAVVTEFGFEQIDFSPITSYKLGLIMARYNHEIL